MVDLQNEFERRKPLLDELACTLEAKTKAALEDVKHIDRITFRVKDSMSFALKAVKPHPVLPMQPKYEAPFLQLEDQVAGRVITFFKDDITIVREALSAWFGAVEHETKEPAGPAEFGYESDHFVFVIPDHCKPDGWAEVGDMPSTFEFQVRTIFMHAWAEPQHDLGYKGELDPETKRELAWVAASSWGADRIMNDIAKRLA